MPTLLMPQPPNDPLLNGFSSGVLLLSILVELYLVSLRRSGPLLPYEPRRPVPWNVAGSALAILMVVLTLLSGIGRSGSHKPLEMVAFISFLVQQVFIVGGFLFVVAVLSSATLRDLGLPNSRNEMARDILIGCVSCLAAFAPVLIVQTALLHWLFPQQEISGHPLIKMVTSAQRDPTILLLASVAVVIVAPICEEITFRLLLQGWLEKWEDSRLGWREETQAQITSDAARLTDDDNRSESSSLDIHPTSIERQPPQRGIAGLPYGAFPILVSALLFGLAHFGYGPEPVPLYLLGLVLGYVYQRTHRIVPGIVVHALFNLLTVIALWRMAYHFN